MKSVNAHRWTEGVYGNPNPRYSFNINKNADWEVAGTEKGCKTFLIQVWERFQSKYIL